MFNWGHRQYFEYFKYQLDSTDRFWVVLDDWFAVAREKLLLGGGKHDENFIDPQILLVGPIWRCFAQITIYFG